MAPVTLVKCFTELASSEIKKILDLARGKEEKGVERKIIKKWGTVQANAIKRFPL
jgi:hypothetical protein